MRDNFLCKSFFIIKRLTIYMANDRLVYYIYLDYYSSVFNDDSDYDFEKNKKANCVMCTPLVKMSKNFQVYVK